MPAAQWLRGKSSRGSSTPPKRLPVPLSQDWKNYTVPMSPKKPQNIIKDTHHPGHSLFELLPLGRCHRAINTRTNRLKHSLYPTAITTLNAAKYNNNVQYGIWMWQKVCMSVDCFYAMTVCSYCLCMLIMLFYVSIYSLFIFHFIFLCRRNKWCTDWRALLISLYLWQWQ